ncbi:MAG: type II toxin-antitoxin system VapC family toxin [Terricaulis sp.]
MILVDTNVISELLRPSPTPNVVSWLNAHFPGCALSSVSIFELSEGVTRMSEGARRDSLHAAITRLVRRFGARIYAYDTQAAYASAELAGRARALGLGLHQIPAKVIDLQIGGIALAYGMEFATRNFRDFHGTGLTLVNPWDT